MNEDIEHQAFWEELQRISKIKEKFDINTDCKDCGEPLIRCKCTSSTIEILKKKIRKKQN